MTSEFADDVNRVFTVQHLRITGNQHTHIVQVRHGPRQRGGNVAQTAGFHQVGNLGGDEQHFLLVGVLAGYRCQRPGPGNADRLRTGSTDGARFADLLMSQLSLNIQSRTNHMNLPCC
ncbi:hypothetical protein D3C80_1784110 [compost metagenome]